MNNRSSLVSVVLEKLPDAGRKARANDIRGPVSLRRERESPAESVAISLV